MIRLGLILAGLLLVLLAVRHWLSWDKPIEPPWGPPREVGPDEMDRYFDDPIQVDPYPISQLNSMTTFVGEVVIGFTTTMPNDGWSYTA